MKNIFTTFCATSLLWSLLILGCVAKGYVERRDPSYAESLQEQSVNRELAMNMKKGVR